VAEDITWASGAASGYAAWLPVDVAFEGLDSIIAVILTATSANMLPPVMLPEPQGLGSSDEAWEQSKLVISFFFLSKFIQFYVYTVIYICMCIYIFGYINIYMHTFSYYFPL